MKIGSVSSIVGGEAVVSLHAVRKPIDLEEARKLIGKSVSLEGSSNTKPVGRITNVLGRTTGPYATVLLSVKTRNLEGKPVFLQHQSQSKILKKSNKKAIKTKK